MKKFFLTLFVLISTFSTQASSICRNAANTVIYKTGDSFAQLTVTEILEGKRVARELELEKHDIVLHSRNLLDLALEGDQIVSTSSVKIRVSKKDGSLFNRSFMDLSSDLAAIETTYICEAREAINL